jgi:hypothetical protein
MNCTDYSELNHLLVFGFIALGMYGIYKAFVYLIKQPEYE